MTISLPQDIEPFGTEWDQPGCYALLYEKPEDPDAAVDRAFDNRPEWHESFTEAEYVLYVGEASNVIRRIEDHAQADKRLTTLSRIGCEPISVEAIEYHDSKEDAEHAEYNTAVRLSRQTDDDTIVICNGSLVG